MEWRRNVICVAVLISCMTLVFGVLSSVLIVLGARGTMPMEMAMAALAILVGMLGIGVNPLAMICKELLTDNPPMYPANPLNELLIRTGRAHPNDFAP